MMQRDGKNAAWTNDAYREQEECGGGAAAMVVDSLSGRAGA